MNSESDEDFVPDEAVEWIEVDDLATSNTSDHEDEDVEFDAVERFNPPQDDAVKILSSHKESVFCLNFDSTGRYLVSGGQDHVAIVWDIETGAEIFRTHGHDDSITCASFSPDDVFLATGDMAGHISVWLRSGTSSAWTWLPLTTFTVGDLLWLRWWKPPAAPRVSKARSSSTINDPVTNAVLLAGDEDGLVTYWPVSSNMDQSKDAANRAKCITGSGEAAIDGQILSSSNLTDRPKLIVLYRNAELRLWDLKSTELMATTQLLTTPTTEPGVFSMVMPRQQQQHQDQRDMVMVAGLGLIHLAVVVPNQDMDYQIKSLEPIKTGDDGSVEAMDCSWTHSLLAFGSVDGALGIVDYRTMVARQKWIYADEDGNGIGITALAWSHVAPIFFTSTVQGSVVAWPGLSSSNSSELGQQKPANQPIPLRIWWGHQAMILDLAVPPTGSRPVGGDSTDLVQMESCVATASDDATIRLFPPLTWET